MKICDKTFTHFKLQADGPEFIIKTYYTYAYLFTCRDAFHFKSFDNVIAFIKLNKGDDVPLYVDIPKHTMKYVHMSQIYMCTPYEFINN